MSLGMELQIDFDFEAAHHLPRVPPDHKCARLHGHSFKCIVTVRGDVDPDAGWLMDFADVRRAIAPIRAQLDHYYLNEVDGLANPTSENLAIWIWDRLQPSLPALAAVTIAETCRARCTYRGAVS